MAKKRVLILYSVKWGRNDGAPLYYLEALKRRDDVIVEHLEPEGDISEFGSWDYTFWVDWGEDGLPRDNSWEIPDYCGKKIYLVSDAHLGPEYRYKKAEEMDFVFFNQKRFIGEYEAREHPASKYPEKGAVQPIYFLPHAAEQRVYKHFDIIPRYDVCFIGHMQDKPNFNGFSRVDMLDRAFAEFPNFYFGTRNMSRPGVNMFEDAARKFCQSKVVLNISIGDDINMRVFETLMTGSFLMTNWLPTLGDVFGDYEGKLFVTYKTLDELVEKTRYYLEHDTEREKIAAAGHGEALKNHTYDKRLETIFDVINH